MRSLPPVDEIIATTGFRPDLAMLHELRLGLDPAVEAPSALAPLIDPNIHSCGSVPPHGVDELSHPEPGFYIGRLLRHRRDELRLQRVISIRRLERRGCDHAVCHGAMCMVQLEPMREDDWPLVAAIYRCPPRPHL
jgi:hypothetical protein